MVSSVGLSSFRLTFFWIFCLCLISVVTVNTVTKQVAVFRQIKCEGFWKVLCFIDQLRELRDTEDECDVGPNEVKTT